EKGPVTRRGARVGATHRRLTKILLKMTPLGWVGYGRHHDHQKGYLAGRTDEVEHPCPQGTDCRDRYGAGHPGGEGDRRQGLSRLAALRRCAFPYGRDLVA